MLGRILGGLLIIVGGGAVMYFANSLSEMFGPSMWAQKYVGGTRNAFLLFGFVVMILGFLMMFGIFTPSVTVGTIPYQ